MRSGSVRPRIRGALRVIGAARGGAARGDGDDLGALRCGPTAASGQGCPCSHRDNGGTLDNGERLPGRPPHDPRIAAFAAFSIGGGEGAPSPQRPSAAPPPGASLSGS